MRLSMRWPITVLFLVLILDLLFCDMIGFAREQKHAVDDSYPPMPQELVIERKPRAHYITLPLLPRVNDRDSAWARALFARITAGAGDNTQRFVMLNTAIHTRVRHPQSPSVKGTPRQIWERGTGWCTNIADVFVYLAQAAGYPARHIAIRHTDGINWHSVVEVNYDYSWHLFDPDHGVEYFLPGGEVASYDSLLRDQSPVAAVPDAWRGANGAGMTGFYKIRY